MRYMTEIRIGTERRCTVDGCNGRMKAVSGSEVEYVSHVWLCNQNHEHTETPNDSEIDEKDIFPPGQ